MCSVGSNLDYTVAMLVVRCYCLPGNPDKLGQHVVGHCPAAESDYVVAQAGLQQDARSHPYTLLRAVRATTAARGGGGGGGGAHPILIFSLILISRFGG